MKRQIWLVALVAAAASVGAGCGEDVDSDDVATDAIHANFWVTAIGDGTADVAGTLRVGGSNSNTYLDLTEYDALMAFVNDTAKGMAKDESVTGSITYRTSFPFEAEDTPYRISFLRSHPPDAECAGVSAPNSTVLLPAPFAITSPAQDAMVSRGSALSIDWTNSGHADSMSWSLDGPCIQPTGDTIANDTGTFTVPADSIMVVGTDQTVSCTATLSIGRGREGDLDPNYGEGGFIRASQRRVVQFQSVQ